MSTNFVTPQFTKGQINRAGELLAAVIPVDPSDEAWAVQVLANWRACHAYPINTFQATLRKRLKEIDAVALVAQRLKRAPSIIFKLQRFEGMKLARMQDIGGLRAVVSSIAKVKKLEQSYRTSWFKHKLVSSKDYISNPKTDGYRGIHLIFRYSNERAPAYDGLSLELQLRTRLQHAWATAVETMGTFLGQALKSGQGEVAWRSFFTNASAAFAILEKTTPVPSFEKQKRAEVFKSVAAAEKQLRVLNKLSGFAIAADKITTEKGQGAYHLVVLDSEKRSVTLRAYSLARLDAAAKDYAYFEQRTKEGQPIEAVLVAAGPIDALRKAYPNYFLDTQEFIKRIQSIITEATSLV